MTESDWLNAIGPERMLAYLSVVRKTDQTPEGERQFRLFACACSQDLPVAVPGRQELEEAVDQHGRALGAIREKATRAAGSRHSRLQGKGSDHERLVRTAWYVIAVAASTDVYATVQAAAVVAEFVELARTATRTSVVAAQVKLVRDIFGNPFRPVAFAPEWRSPAAVALADAMYASRDFGPMPVLADALEEAGCDHPDVLAHCRCPGPHVRGCWVVDLILGKT